MPAIEWREFAFDHGVLEFHQTAGPPGPALGLQLIRSADGRFVTFWVTSAADHLTLRSEK